MPEKFTSPTETKSSNRESLETQFEHPEKFDIGKGLPKLEIHDVVPERKKSETAVLLMPGWSGTPRAYKENMLAQAELGRRIISPNAPHGIDAEPIPNYPISELRKVQAIIKSMDLKGIKKIDAVGHSEGGIDVVLAATLYPEKFRNIVLVDPGGMIGKDKALNLAARFAKDLAVQAKRDVIEKIRSLISGRPSDRITPDFMAAAKAILPEAKKSFQEVVAISESDIREMLTALKKKGIGVSIVSSVDDQTFAMARMQRSISERLTKTADGKLNMLDGFYSAKGTHNEFILRPRLYTKLVDQALSDLEQRKEK